MTHHPSRLAVVVLGLIGLGAAGLARAEKTPAFPGAEGFGAYALGGRGGKVLFVTTLEDYDPHKEEPIPGSLRAACRTEGPRTILFRVSGTIFLKSLLEIKHGRLTLAGQSAPGQGICLKGHSTVIKRTQDVIVRHIRFRPGDELGIELDSLSVSDAQSVIVDHCSTSWGIDESLSVTGAQDVTVQRCMIAEALHESHHHKGNHGYGSLINGDRISFHHNIYAHNRSRNPRPGGSDDHPNLILDFRNNLIYNWGDRAGYNGEDPIRLNYIGNYLEPGPSTRDRDYAFSIGGKATRMYLEDNFLAGHDAANQDNWLMVRGQAEQNRAREPFPVPAVQTQSPKQAHDSLLEDCGAILPERDAVDKRVIETIKTGAGEHINSQTEVGGWPELKSAPAPKDTDNDGMPDDWETQHGLNPEQPGNNEDPDGDGYTNIEEFLNRTDPEKTDRG
jgi:pectate lyase